MKYEQEINELVQLIEAMSDEEMNILFVSCMSSDTLYDKESCEKSLKAIDMLTNAISKSNVSCKKKHSWLEHTYSIKAIILKDYELLKEDEEE